MSDSNAADATKLKGLQTFDLGAEINKGRK